MENFRWKSWRYGEKIAIFAWRIYMEHLYEEFYHQTWWTPAVDEKKHRKTRKERRTNKNNSWWVVDETWNLKFWQNRIRIVYKITIEIKTETFLEHMSSWKYFSGKRFCLRKNMKKQKRSGWELFSQVSGHSRWHLPLSILQWCPCCLWPRPSPPAKSAGERSGARPSWVFSNHGTTGSEWKNTRFGTWYVCLKSSC